MLKQIVIMVAISMMSLSVQAYSAKDASTSAIHLEPGWAPLGPIIKTESTVETSYTSSATHEFLQQIIAKKPAMGANQIGEFIQSVYDGFKETAIKQGCEVSELMPLPQPSTALFSAWAITSQCKKDNKSFIVLLVDADIATLYMINYILPIYPLMPDLKIKAINKLKSSVQICYEKTHCSSVF